MEIKSKDLIDFLSQRQTFKDLSAEEVGRIADRFEESRLEAGEDLFYQGDRGDKFYIIYSGSVSIWLSDDDGATELAVLERGDQFGEESLLFNRPRSASVTAVKNCHFLTIDLGNFNWMLRAFPDTMLNLRAIAESHREARRLRFDWLQDGEVIYQISRRHPAELWVDLARPAVVSIIAGILLFVGFIGVRGITSISYILGGIMLVFGVLWSIWEAIDWRNDYFIITNQRVVWLEQVLLQSESRQETPMSAIQSVNVVTSQVGRILGYGDVYVRTYTGTGSLNLNFVNRPNRFRDIIDELLVRVRVQTEEAQTEAMRQSIRTSLGLSDAEPVDTAIGIMHTDPQKDNILRVLKTREIQGDMITYHKHWWVLLVKIWLPALGMLGLVGLVGLSYFAGSGESISFIPTLFTACTVGVLVGAILLTILIYQYVDWRNDIYRLTRDTIIDTEKKPLGNEITKSAPIKNIQSLEHERIGILRLMLNFGTVKVNIADTTLTFSDVHKPAQVQQDIFYRQEQLKFSQEESIAKRERARMAEWLKAYHEVWEIEQKGSNGEDESVAE